MRVVAQSRRCIFESLRIVHGILQSIRPEYKLCGYTTQVRDSGSKIIAQSGDIGMNNALNSSTRGMQQDGLNSRTRRKGYSERKYTEWLVSHIIAPATFSSILQATRRRIGTLLYPTVSEPKLRKANECENCDRW